MDASERMSDRHAKSGEDMLEVLTHDLMRYETLFEQSELFALASALAETVQTDDSGTVYVELPVTGEQETDDHDEKENTPPSNSYQKSPPFPSNERFIPVTTEDTDNFIASNRNKNTNYKTKSDMKIFNDWLLATEEYRDVTDIPAVELDSLLARFYLSHFLQTIDLANVKEILWAF